MILLTSVEAYSYSDFYIRCSWKFVNLKRLYKEWPDHLGLSVCEKLIKDRYALWVFIGWQDFGRRS